MKMHKLSRTVCVVAALTSAACGGGTNANSPEAPSQLAGSSMGGGFHLTWKDNSQSETEFVVQQRMGTGSFTELARVPFNTTQYHVASGHAGMEHGYQVIAVKDSALSTASNEVTWSP